MRQPVRQWCRGKTLIIRTKNLMERGHRGAEAQCACKRDNLSF